MARKINPKAKKWARIREKQRQANAMLSEANKSLKTGHRATKNAKSRKKTFYNARGLKTPSKLSMKNLTTKDMDAYERLLDSIIDNTYLNKTKREEHQKKQREYLISNGYANTDEEADSIYDLLDSDIVQDLMALGVKPSDVMAVIHEYDDSGYDSNSFVEMLSDFMYERKVGKTTVITGDETDLSINEFFAYADNWTPAYSQILRQHNED